MASKMIPIFDGVLDSADSDRLVGLVDLERPGSIQHLEVRQGIFVNDDQVGELTDLNRADLVIHPQKLSPF